MKQVSAKVAFRWLAVVLGLGGVGLTAWGLWGLPASLAAGSGVGAGMAAGMGTGMGTGYIATGALLALIALLGPARIVLSGVLIPAEIKRTITVVGASVLLAGCAFLAAGLLTVPGLRPLAVLVCGLCALAAALGGFFRLSLRLPDTFYLHEMAGIIKSAGLMGKAARSPANREFLRWSKGVREGVAVGGDAPDGMVTTLDGKTVPLSTYFKAPGEAPSPLVLNFGSYSCPHHRKRIGELHGLLERWQGQGVRFLTVYIAEAHPEDGWVLENQYRQDAEYTGNPEDFCFTYAKTIEDRLAMARWLIDKKHFRLPVVLDAISDALLTAYNAWPIRLYLIDGGKVVYCGKQGPFGYAPGELEAALEKQLG